MLPYIEVNKRHAKLVWSTLEDSVERHSQDSSAWSDSTYTYRLKNHNHKHAFLLRLFYGFNLTPSIPNFDKI